jgi:hypothetical protein
VLWIIERFGVTQALEEILYVRGATQRPWCASLAEWLAAREKKSKSQKKKQSKG